MTERLFGMEIEYGCAVRGRDKRAHHGRDWMEQFMATAGERLPHLHSIDGSGIFLQNGARLYVDCAHPEMTTPECANPWDLVRYMRAGELMLLAVADEMTRRERTLAEVLLFKTNVDHSDTHVTWGCHTSFMHRGQPEKFPTAIIPHLVSRIIYSGAGGIELGLDGQLCFTLSPRVRFLSCEVSPSSTSDRGIFHTKDESLAAHGYHRLHLICGESLCSETALWLTTGATALIVAMIEAGLQPGRAVQLANSVEAMRQIASDPACASAVPTAGGRSMTAIQIQRHYLELAEAHQGAPFMPPWAPQVCAQWRAMLDRLSAGAPGSVATTLDWGIKLGLFMNHAQKRGLATGHWHHLRPAAAAAPRSAAPHWMSELSEILLPQEAMPEVAKVHQELCEIDTRFGQLGVNGIFAILDRAGVLSHRVAGVENIEYAVENGPSVGRARLRAQFVKRLAGQHHRFGCGWQQIVDHEKNLTLDISDPFATEERWQPAQVHEQPPFAPSSLHRLLNRAREHYERGDNETAAHFLALLAARPATLDIVARLEFLRLHAWVQSRRGYLDSILALDEMARQERMSLLLVNSYVCAYRHQGLIPPPAIEGWIRRGQEMLPPLPDPYDSAALPFLGHWGYYLLRNGQPEAALRVLEDACHPARRASANPGAVARALSDLADARRTLGMRNRAVAALAEAEALQTAGQLEGDRADSVLTIRAKLETEPNRALEYIAQAKTIQSRFGNVVGEARSTATEARLLRSPADAARLKARLQELRGLRPALAQCPLLANILHRWESWAGGRPEPDRRQDPFWFI